MLLTAIRILILIISFFGYTALLRKKGIPMPFVPVITLTAAGSILFLAGILNLLPQATVLLVAAGLYLAAARKLWKPRGLFSRQDWICLGIFAGICIFFAWRLSGTVPLHYDNFTHWLRAMRDTLNSGRFPNFQSEMIIFQSYPTGSAGFAYFLCKTVGLESDSVLLFSQALMMAAALCTMLAFCKDLRLPGLLVFALGCVYCLVANPSADDNLLQVVPNIVDISICELLPDTLISILSIASAAIVIFFRKDLRRAAWLSLPVQIYLVTVKNSGLFMIVFNTVLLLYYICCSRSEKKSEFGRQLLSSAAVHCGIPFLVYFLWNRHVDLVFQWGNYARHSVSLEYYRGILGGKTFAQIMEILTAFLKRFFSWSDSWILLAVCIFAFGTVFFLRKKDCPNASREVAAAFIGIVAAYIIFMMGQAFMYLASMNYDEGIRLACYDRYEKTVLVYLVGLIAVFLLSCLSDFSSGKQRKTVCVTAVLSMALILSTQISRVDDLFLKTKPYEGSVRQFLEEARQTYQIPDGASCLILLDSPPEDDWGYSGYLAQYVFWSNSVRIFTAPVSDLSALAAQYDYLIIQNEDAAAESFLLENGYTPGSTVHRLNTAAK